ncbi:MAG: hypothetical protein H6Q86_4892 [candidate division NC10 bacterium]|nr:hypothetical protein [candidate division NC10 bacterium]
MGRIIQDCIHGDEGGESLLGNRVTHRRRELVYADLRRALVKDNVYCE